MKRIDIKESTIIEITRADKSTRKIQGKDVLNFMIANNLHEIKDNTSKEVVVDKGENAEKKK